MSIIYSVQINGNIKTSNVLKIKLCIPKFQSGAWMLCLSTICYQPKEPNLNAICQLSTNLIKGQKYDSNNQIHFFYPVISSVLLKGAKNSYNVVYLEPIWLTINEIAENFELYCNKFETNAVLNHDTFIDITVLFKKVI